MGWHRLNIGAIAVKKYQNKPTVALKLLKGGRDALNSIHKKSHL